MLTSVRLTAPPASLAEPQTSPAVVLHPLFQPLALYAVPAVGKAVVTVGAALSTVKVTAVPALLLPTPSIE